MAKLLNLSLDLTKIDKSKIKEHTNGSKYYNITVAINDEADKFGNNVGAWNQQTKEEQAAKQPKTYIGSGKIFWSNDTPAPQVDNRVHNATPIIPNDLPF